jgi:hypothetical protein
LIFIVLGASQRDMKAPSDFTQQPSIIFDLDPPGDAAVSPI